MSRPTALATLAISTLVLSGCAGKSSPAQTTSSAPATSSPVSIVPATPTAAASPTAPAVDQTITITYAGGKVSGVSAVVKVKQNSTVALTVTSDVADEVHLHGYDKMADVTKGGTVTIVFKATLPGKWEVELEKLKHRLVFLQVQ
jgi:PBP1b-binding outer membrane lipoprotein LpoB